MVHGVVASDVVVWGMFERSARLWCTDSGSSQTSESCAYHIQYNIVTVANTFKKSRKTCHLQESQQLALQTMPGKSGESPGALA